jgi:hypothetical protein
MRSKRLTVGQKKEIFNALVVMQDRGDVSVTDSKKRIMEQFHVTENQLRQIQEEGIEKEWPPLDEEPVQLVG